jgi:hypothetical protein
MIRRIALVLLSGLFLLGLGTYLAGERTEVGVLKTYDAAGTSYQTKMWVVDLDGHAYVRIGRPGRGWGERVKAHPDVELERNGASAAYTAALVTDPAQRAAIDQAFADKYGWVDWWYGVVVRKNPEAVRLDPRASAGN